MHIGLGAVLCVKWSPAGAPVDYLASAADDSIVLIWRREAEYNYGGPIFPRFLGAPRPEAPLTLIMTSSG